MDRGAWQATVPVVARVGYDSATKPQLPHIALEPYNIPVRETSLYRYSNSKDKRQRHPGGHSWVDIQTELESDLYPVPRWPCHNASLWN